jgi:hypothetical protein
MELPRFQHHQESVKKTLFPNSIELNVLHGVPADKPVKFYRVCVHSVPLYACQVFHCGLPKKYLNISLELRVQKRSLPIILLKLSELSSLDDHRAELQKSLIIHNATFMICSPLIPLVHQPLSEIQNLCTSFMQNR